MQNIKKVHSQKLIHAEINSRENYYYYYCYYYYYYYYYYYIIIIIIIIINTTVINLFNVDNQNIQIMRIVKNNYL